MADAWPHFDVENYCKKKKKKESARWFLKKEREREEGGGGQRRSDISNFEVFTLWSALSDKKSLWSENILGLQNKGVRNFVS